jgi:proteasome lid subunit RPN8/RPN11
MFRGLLTTVSRYLRDWSEALAVERLPAPELFAPAGQCTYRRLERVVLAEEVARTLMRDYADHRAGPRGAEEVGWVLLGLRDEVTATVLATLPAGADREAGVAHVHFNSTAQAVASRIVRQTDRRLGIVGVVHTHPGSLRHPSDGDFRGDSLWVSRLRGGDGVFGIGTADGKPANGKPASHAAHMRTEGELCFSWYALGAGDRHYRRLPVDVVDGPDLARSLHPIWNIIETHAVALDVLFRQLAKVKVEPGESGHVLLVRIPVGDSGDELRIQVGRQETAFHLKRDGDTIVIDPAEPQLDRAVFLVLAELAGQRHAAEPQGSEREGATGSRPLAVW